MAPVDLGAAFRCFCRLLFSAFTARLVGMQTQIQSTRPSLVRPVLFSASRATAALSGLAWLIWLGWTGAGFAQEANLKWQSADMTKELGGYMPQRLKLSTNKPVQLKKVPDGVQAPLYGELTIGPKESPAHYLVLVDEPEGKPPRLFVDANGKQNVVHVGETSVKIPFPSGKVDAQLGVYRFDKSDTGRTALLDSLFYYRDYAL